MLVVICGTLWLLAAGSFSCFVRFVVLLLCFLGPIWHCDDLVGEERAGCVALCWFVKRALSTVNYLLFLLIPL